MILVIGGTGFIGRNLVRSLVESGQQVRILLRPSKHSPNIPKGIPVEVAVSSLSDERGLRASMKGIDAVYHFASAERQGARGDLNAVDVQGTASISRSAADAGIEHLIFISHHGADRLSAFPALRAKGIAEGWIVRSEVPYTIIRTDGVFGAGDQFTLPIYRLLRSLPVFIMPGDGSTLLQPLYVNDLVTCLLMVLKNDRWMNRTISVGGGELVSYADVVRTVMQVAKRRRPIFQMTPSYLRTAALWLDQLSPRFPMSIYWLDTLAIHRTTHLDVLPKDFGIIPARFKSHLDYLASPHPSLL
jgi:NADH dehydrogenase